MLKGFQLIKTYFPVSDFSSYEKNVFCGLFNALIAKGRLEWRTCCEIYSKEEEANPDDITNYKLRCIHITKAKIENEVREICKQQYVIAKHFLEKS